MYRNALLFFPIGQPNLFGYKCYRIIRGEKLKSYCYTEMVTKKMVQKAAKYKEIKIKRVETWPGLE